MSNSSIESNNPQVKVPSEISDYFKVEDFEKYPFVEIPQSFIDSRGKILNIADGKLGDVAIITSKIDSIRANHVHEQDWHLSYIIRGEMTYLWRDGIGDNILKSIKCQEGAMIFTPPKVPHKMIFHDETLFIAISKMSRLSESYEKDTSRLRENFFDA